MISEVVFLAVFSEKDLGLMVIVRSKSAQDVADIIQQNNPDKNAYHTQFKHPNGNFIVYDLNAPKDTWVIKSVNNNSVDRDFGRWPFFEGNIEGLRD
jgi:hypothetical protein